MKGNSMKFACFDLEIAKNLPDDGRSWDAFRPFGITCAALALEDRTDPIIWQGYPQLDPESAASILDVLAKIVSEGYTLLTWNGCSFDFRVVAEESGAWDAAASLAADHIDLMLMFTFQQGHYLGLEKALRGANLAGKRKAVTLSDGRVLTGMTGKMAPQLWMEQEFEAVLEYLVDDVRQPIELARDILASGAIRWVSSRGAPQQARFDRLYTVREAFQFPRPTLSWGRPPNRSGFIAWMPGGKLPDPTAADQDETAP
jgi:hypothetical protein